MGQKDTIYWSGMAATILPNETLLLETLAHTDLKTYIILIRTAKEEFMLMIICYQKKEL